MTIIVNIYLKLNIYWTANNGKSSSKSLGWMFKNTETLSRRLHSRSKASAVSNALSIAEGITRSIERGEEVLIRTKDGSLERVFIAGVSGI